ncbi:hypothetical protein Gogos_008446 [Gossypium gossypioides]|uniref:Uncharacterized protein n=1 Tax=Gossypium gossypioides TaxID=34282 RepID=A0A7J9CBP2_GOSGO|nr:hypothetical protein [Gossypium gossypioides]
MEDKYWHMKLETSLLSDNSRMKF